MSIGIWCDGHQDGVVLADIIMTVAWEGAERWPAQYSVCIDCAEAFQDAVSDDWEDWRINGLRGYTWQKHPNCKLWE